MPKLLRYNPDNDYYKVLGVAPAATPEEINRAYRNRAKIVHPDLNRDRREWAHDQFQHLNEAHDTLVDPVHRAEYDQKRRLYLETHQPGVRNPALAEASRAAWARRHRRRPPALYYLSAGILMFGAIPVMYWIIASIIFSAGLGADGSTRTNQPVPLVVAPTSIPVVALSSPRLLPTTTYTLPDCNQTSMTITEPHNGDNVYTPFVIRGSAFGEQFSAYEIDYATADATLAYGEASLVSLYSEGGVPIENGILVPAVVTSRQLSGANGDFTLALKIWTDNHRHSTLCGITVHLNPKISATAAATSLDS